MKKFATLLAVILMAFGACFLTACTQPYSKIYLEVYDAQGTKLELDEDYRFVLNDNGENDFSLSVKVRGVKKEKVTVGFTKKSSTTAFSILEYQTVGDTATVKLRGDNRGVGYLYVRVLESDKVKEIAVPIKIVKEITNLEVKPDVYTAVTIGTSITLDNSMLAFTPYNTNETEVEFALSAQGAQRNYVTLVNNKLTVAGGYNIDDLGETIKITATSKYKQNLKAEFDVYVVESLNPSNIALSYFDYDNKTLVSGDGQNIVNVGNEITLVKGADAYKSVYIAISANSNYKFNEEVGLEVMAYLPNNQIVKVTRCNDLTDVEYPVYRVSSELFDGTTKINFKVYFSKFGNIAAVEKSVNVRVIDMPYALMLNGETEDVYDLDLYTSYDSSSKGLALNFNVLPNNVINEYNQIYLNVENVNIAEALVLRYVDDYGVLRTIQPSQTEYVLPRNKTVYVSLNPAVNYTDYIATGIKLNAWCYTTIDKFAGRDVTDRNKKNVLINLAIKQGISGIGVYKDGANNIVDAINENISLVANNVTSGGTNRTIYLDFTPTGSVDVNKNITIQSAKPSVVQFVLGGTTYSRITGNQLSSVVKNTSSSIEKTLYALTIKGFDKGETQIIVTTGNGVTKYINITTVAGTNSLSLNEASTRNIAYSLTETGSFYRGYTDIIVPAGSAINLKVNGTTANADIAILNARVIGGENGLSQNEVVSLYDTGSQITLTGLIEGVNRVQFNVQYFDMNGNSQTWFISFYVYVYIPVRAFELSTHSASLMYNVGYFEKEQYSQLTLGVRYNAEGATETIELLSTYAKESFKNEADNNKLIHYDSATGKILLRVYTITRTLNESIFMGSLESTARMDKNNLNIQLKLNELQDMPTNTNVTVNLQQFDNVVSSQRCNITIRKAVKAENIVVNNISKKSGAYVINFDLRNGRCGLTKTDIEKYLLNPDNNFKQILASITNANDVTFNQIDYKIVKYLNDYGDMVDGDDSTISIVQSNGEFTLIPHKGGEVILHIFPHDRWISATEYDRNGPVIEIDIKVSDGDKVPYQIGSVSQLLAIGENEETMSYKYELVSDINLTYKGATAVLPIGKTKNGILAFTGSLSGAYKINKDDGSVLSVQYYLRNPVFTLENSGTESFAGLFAQNDGILRNIYIDNARFAVYGAENQAITLNDVTFTNYYLAGLVGKNNGQIIDCYVGLARNGVENSEIKFDVTVNKEFNIYAGGLVAYNMGSITANSIMSSGELNLSVTKSITQSNQTSVYLGGIIGQNKGIIDGNYQSDYQRYAREFNPKLADFNNGKYYVLVDGEYTKAKTNTSVYDPKATYYRLSAGVLESNKRVLSEHISTDIVLNASIATDYSYIGGIAGYNNGIIGNVSFNGVIDCISNGKTLVGRVGETVTSFVGGLVGYNKGNAENEQDIYNSIAIACQILTADENVNNKTEKRDGDDIGLYMGAGAVGGAVGGSENSKLYLVGTQFMTTIDDENYTSITANQVVGGLIGISNADEISYCYVESFFKQYAAGDLAKSVNTMNDIALYENADVSLTSLASGFIASANDSKIDRSFAKLNVAFIPSDTSVTNSDIHLAGLLSAGSAQITNSYFKGNLINADSDAGLLASAYASANVASVYAKGYINAPSFDADNLQDSYAFLVVEKDGTLIENATSYMFGDDFSDSITSNNANNNYIWFYDPNGSEYNDGDPVQWCNGVKFATLIPTAIRIEINADEDGAIYKSQANINDDSKNLLAGYKYDDSTMILFYRSFVAGNEYANYMRLNDLISAIITPDQAKADIEYKIVDGNIARINKVNGYSCVTLSTTGKFTLRVYAIYNSALYQDITVYVTNGVSEYDLYNTTDTSASQNKLADGRVLSLATDSSTIFSSKVRFTDGNVTNNIYNTNTALYLDFDVNADEEIFTINEQSPNNNFKADKNLAIKTVSSDSEILKDRQDKITAVKVTPYIDLHELFADNFAAGERIKLLPLVREFNFRVCKRASAINTNNVLAIASESSRYASLNIELVTDYTSSVLPTIDTLTNGEQLNETDALRLSISADEDSQAFVDKIMSTYGEKNVTDLFDISCEILPSANGIMYNDLRIQLKEDYRELDNELHFNLHFWADSNADVTSDVGLTITPSSITKIVMNHFAETSASQTVGGSTKQTVQSNSATNMIVPGKSGIMMISVNPIYANVDYFTIESSQNIGYSISFEQMVKVEGKDEYITLFPRPSAPNLAKYSTIDADGNLSYDGNLYVRTILPTIVARELNFEVTVNAYLNTSPTSLKRATKTLLTAYVPEINLTVDQDDAVSVYLMEPLYTEDGTNNVLDASEMDLYIRYTTERDDAKYIYNEKVKVDENGEITYRNETAYYVPLQEGQDVNREMLYVRREYFLVENNTSNIRINMEVVGYEFGSPSYDAKWLDTPDEDGQVIAQAPTLVRTQRGVYAGSSRLTIMGNESNVGKRLKLTAKIEVLRNGIRKDAEKELRFIIVENIIRPRNVTIGNLTDDNTLSFAMGSSQSLDIVWKTDTGILNKEKQEKINRTLYDCIGGVGTDFNAERLANLFYIRRNTVYGITNDPLKLGTDSSSLFRIKENYTNREFTGLTIIGTSQTNGTVLGFKVYYYYDENLELKFTTDYEAFKNKYVLTEINFEFNLLIYYTSTEQEPIPIYTASQFKSYLSATVSDTNTSNTNYILMADIALEDYEPFNANFSSLDGNGKVIKIYNFTPSAPTSESTARVGLFKTVSANTIIKNVTLDVSMLKDINLVAYSGYEVGLLAVSNAGIITNCDVVALRLNSSNTTSSLKTINILAQQSTTTAHFGGLVVNNTGNITNSRIGVPSFVSYIINSTDTKTETDTQTYISNDILITGVGDMGGFVYSNSGIISSSYVRGLNFTNNSTELDTSKTAGFVVNNTGRIYFSYVRGSGDATVGRPRMTSTSITSNGDVAGFVSKNSGYIGDCYANIKVFSVSKFTAGFVGSNSSSIERCYSACDIESNAPRQTPFTGTNILHELQDSSNGGIVDCYYLILSGESFPIEDDSAHDMSISSFQMANTLNNFNFVNSTNVDEAKAGIWIYNFEDENAKVKESYVLPDLTSPNEIAKSLRYLNTELTDEQGNVVGYSYLYNKGYELGSQINPYIIRYASEFNKVFADALTADDSTQIVQSLANVRFVSDIDFKDVGNEVKTRERVVFSGQIDGNGMQINGINITTNTTNKALNSLGLFSKVIKANTIDARTPIIKNITLNYTKLSGTSTAYVGGLAGIIRDSYVINVNLTGGIVVQAYNYAGGLAGMITGKSLIMNVNSNLSVSVGNHNEIVDQYGHYVPYTYFSFEDYSRINRNSTQESYENYLTTLSYAGGLAGVIDLKLEEVETPADLTRPNVNLVKINAIANKTGITSVGSNVSVFADVVGGVAGYAGVNTYINSTKFYLNTASNNNSILQGYYSVGGLIGENLGKLAVSELVCDNDSQLTIDKANGAYIRGETNTISGNYLGARGSYFAGGLIGINYQGAVEHCQTHLSLYDCDAQFVGGIVGGTLGGAFNTMYTASAMPVLTKENTYSGGFAGITFNAFNKNKLPVEMANSIWQQYINNYINAQPNSLVGKISVVLNRVVCAQYYDHAKLTELNANEHNGSFIGYSALTQKQTETDSVFSYRGSQLDTLYASSNKPTNCFVDGTYYYDENNSVAFNEIAHFDQEDDMFDTKMLDLKTMSIETLTNREEGHEADQRAEFQKVFSEWSLNYWTALDETTIYPRLLQIGFGSVIEIDSASDLKYIDQNPSGSFVITRDINMNGVDLEDCVIRQTFTGRLIGYKEDGSAPTIYNMSMKATSNDPSCLAFFHEIKNATISNINFRYKSFNADQKGGNVAGVVAVDLGGSTLSEITVGFNGNFSNSTTLKEYDMTQTLTAMNAGNVGGLVAESNGTNIVNCEVRMNISSGADNTGGLVGSAHTASNWITADGYAPITTVVSSVYFGNIDCTTDKAENTKAIGGLVGKLTNGAINNSRTYLLKENNEIDKEKVANITFNQCYTGCNELYVGGLVGQAVADISQNKESIGFTNCEVLTNITALTNAQQGQNIYIGYVVGHATSASFTTITVHKDCKLNASNGLTLNDLYYGGISGYGFDVTISESTILSEITLSRIKALTIHMGGAFGHIMNNASKISGVLVSNTISTKDLVGKDAKIYVGGIVGETTVETKTDGVIAVRTSAHFGKINIGNSETGTYYVGGIIGFTNGVQIEACQTGADMIIGNIKDYEIAGIVGYISASDAKPVTITRCIMLSYFKLSNQLVRSNNYSVESGVDPICMGNVGDSSTGNIYSADYSFIVARQNYIKNKNDTTGFLTNMRADQLLGKLTNNGVVLSYAVNAALSTDKTSLSTDDAYVLNRADRNSVGGQSNVYAMGALPNNKSTSYVMPYLITLGERMSANELFKHGSVMRPKVLTETDNIFTEESQIFVVWDNFTFNATPDKLNSRIVGCGVTFELGSNFVQTIGASGAISGVTFSAKANVNGVRVSNNGGVIANTNQGVIFDCHMIDEITIDSSTMTSGTDKFGCVVGVNNGTIFGFGNGAKFTLGNGAKQFVSGIAVTNNGRIEGCYVTADLTEVALNNPNTAGLVHTNLGVIYNTYFAGALSGGGTLDDALVLNQNIRTGGETCLATMDVFTHNDENGKQVGQEKNVYVDYYANCKTGELSTTTTTRALFENGGDATQLLVGNIWATQRYIGNEATKGHYGNLQNVGNTIIVNLNYGYPIINIGTRIYNYKDVDPDSSGWIKDEDSQYKYIGRESGDGSNKNPIEIINLGVMDYTRSLYSNTNVKEYKLTRNIVIANNSTYSLSNYWSKNADDNDSSYYGATTTFKQIFNGNEKIIFNLYGGALFNTLEEKTENNTQVGGIISDVNLFNSYSGDSGKTVSGGLVGKLTSGTVQKVNVYGVINASAAIANTMSGGTITECKILADQISGNESTGGVVHTISGGRITKCQVSGADNQIEPKIIGVKVGAAGLAYSATGSAVLQDNTVSGVTIQAVSGFTAGAIAKCDAKTVAEATDTDKYVLYNNKISATVAGGGHVAGLVGQLSGGNIDSNHATDDNAKIALQGTAATSILGGLIGQSNRTVNGTAKVTNNKVTLGIATGDNGNNADSKNKRFGGLLGEDLKEITFEGNTISGKFEMNKNETSNESISGGLTSIPVASKFKDNTISLTITDFSANQSSAMGGYFGKVGSDYSLSDSATQTTDNTPVVFDGDGNTSNVPNYTNTNLLTAKAQFQGVFNVGLQVGYMTAWNRAALDSTSSNVNKSTIAIGFKNVGGMVGKIEKHTETISNLESKGIIKSMSKMINGESAPSNFGGLFGAINDKSKVTLSNLTNGCNIETLGTEIDSHANLVGGIVGKLGAVPKYYSAKKSTVNSEVKFGGESGYDTQEYTIENCASTAKIQGKYYVGGIVGSLATQGAELSLNSLESSGEVKGYGVVGGILGLTYTPGDKDTTLKIAKLTNQAKLDIVNVNDGGDYFGGITGTIFSTNRILYTSVKTGEDGNETKVCDFDGLTNSGKIIGGNYTGGLFGKIVSTSGSIKGFVGVAAGGNVTGKDYVGGIMGEYTIDPNLPNGTVFTISDITSGGTRKGQNYVGGLFGRLDLTGYEYNENGELQEVGLYTKNIYARISNITNNAIIEKTAKGDEYIGGIIGELDAHNAIVDITPLNDGEKSLINTRAVSGGGYTGGIFGNVKLNNEITVNKQDAAGNVVEENFHSTITDLHNTGTITGTADYVGGVIGYLNYTDSKAVGYTVYNLVNGGVVNASDASNVGGIFGSVKNYNIYGISEESIDKQYTKQIFKNTASVKGRSNVGGIIGYTANDVSNLNGKLLPGSYGYNVLYEVDNVGNLVVNSTGEKAGIGANISNTGSVTGKNGGNNVGGFIGCVTSDPNGKVQTSGKIDYLFATSELEVHGGTNVGGVIGYYNCPNDSYLTFTSRSNMVEGGSNVGGLIGRFKLTTSNAPKFINKLTYVGNGTISGEKSGEYVGGLVGYIETTGSNTTIDLGFEFKTAEKEILSQPDTPAIVAVDTISGGSYIGGLLGYGENINIKNAKVTFGSINGNQHVGGLVGSVKDVTITNCYLLGNNTQTSTATTIGELGASYDVGGLVGKANHIETNYVLIDGMEICGVESVGGLIGSTNSSGNSPINKISQYVYVMNSKVSGSNMVGGIIGSSCETSLSRAKAGLKLLSGESNVGGVIGKAESTEIDNPRFTIEELSGSENVGGLVGYYIASAGVYSYGKFKLGFASLAGDAGYHIGTFTCGRNDNYTAGNSIGILDVSDGGCTSLKLQAPKIDDGGTSIGKYTVGTIIDQFYVKTTAFDGTTLSSTYANKTTMTIDTISQGKTYPYGQIKDTNNLSNTEIMHANDADESMLYSKLERVSPVKLTLTYGVTISQSGPKTCAVNDSNRHYYTIYTYKAAVTYAGEFNDEPKSNDISGTSTGGSYGTCNQNENGECTAEPVDKYARESVTIKTNYKYEYVLDEVQYTLQSLLQSYLPVYEEDGIIWNAPRAEGSTVTVMNKVTEKMILELNIN